MRLRLIISFILIVLVSVIGVVLVARQGTANEVRTFMFRGGMAGSDGLVTSLESYYHSQGSWEGVESLLTMPGHGKGQGMMGGMMDQRLRLADADGNLIADTNGSSISGELSQEQMQTAIQLMDNGRTIGFLLAEGGSSFTSRDETFLLERLNRAALTAGVIAGVVSLFLAVLLAYSLLKPVRELTNAARRLGDGDLTQRVKESGNDELGSLARTFNLMASSLQRSEESRRAMTADIAHELRNPLAVQRANLEALQDGVYPLSADSINQVLDQNLLLTHLVDDLRILALAEAGGLKLENVPTDMVDLITKVVDRHRPQASMRQVDLHVEQPAQSTKLNLVPVDPVRIEQILNNLLSNALRFTPENGRITVQLSAHPKGVKVQVRDSGPGIPAEALPHVFERFYRADRSRSRSEGGTGLGLAIARQLAELHGGSLLVENHPQGGALFTLTLPYSDTEIDQVTYES